MKEKKYCFQCAWSVYLDTKYTHNERLRYDNVCLYCGIVRNCISKNTLRANAPCQCKFFPATRQFHFLTKEALTYYLNNISTQSGTPDGEQTISMHDELLSQNRPRDM